MSKQPVSGKTAPMDYKVELAAEVDCEKTTKEIMIQVSAKALCPCSKAISEYGAHNQRSTITATLGFDAKTEFPFG